MKTYPNLIENISFIDEKVENVNDFCLIDYANLIDEKSRCQWGYERTFMIIKIYFKNLERYIYLMEISRRGTSYRGLLFETPILEKDFLVNLITQTSKKKGVVKKIHSLDGVYLYDYDHTLGKGNMSDKILRELKRYLSSN